LDKARGPSWPLRHARATKIPRHVRHGTPDSPSPNRGVGGLLRNVAYTAFCSDCGVRWATHYSGRIDYRYPVVRCVEYEWDEAKAAANFAKHRISFTAAARALEDPRKIKFLTTGSTITRREFRVSAWSEEGSCLSSQSCQTRRSAAMRHCRMPVARLPDPVVAPAAGQSAFVGGVSLRAASWRRGEAIVPDLRRPWRAISEETEDAKDRQRFLV
jgi:uncharacterized DUF497 family protein